MGDVKLVDSMMLDGLIDAFHDYHMGITGKKNGQCYKIMRHQNISYGRQIIFPFAFCSSKTKPQVAESLLIKSNSCWNC